MVNERISSKLNHLAELAAIAGEKPYVVSSYKRASKSILKHDLSQVNPSDIKGIGDSISKLIVEIMETGTCKKLEKYIKKYQNINKLAKIPGIGPKKAKELYKKYKAHKLSDIQKLIDDGTITDKRIIEGIKTGPKKKIPYNKAKKIADRIINNITNNCNIERIEACGSIRRKELQIGDIDIIIQSKDPKVYDVIKSMLDVVSDDGDSKIGGNIGDIHCDIRFADEEYYGSMILYFTGNTEFNIQMRSKAISLGWKLNEYGLWSDNNRIAGSTELEIFEKLGRKFIDPDERV